MIGFAGLERDTVTGLNIAVFREENPATGRWVSQDPLGFAAEDANLDRYIGNGPADAADPVGLFFPLLFPAPTTGPFDSELYYDWSQYEQLYNNGEISWWQWIALGIFTPSDVQAYTRWGNQWYQGGRPIAAPPPSYRPPTERPMVYGVIPSPILPGVPTNPIRALPRTGSNVPSPALESSPYHPNNVAARIRPPYRANPAHNPGSPLFNPRKTPEPSDAAAAYATAVRCNMKTWYALSSDGKVYYRYFYDNAGGVHFSGSFSPNQVPRLIRDQLGR